MDFLFVHIAWVHVLLIILNTAFFIYAWEIRKEQGPRYFLAVLITGSYWLLCQAFEFCALDLETKLFWANIQYIAPTLIVAFFSMYAMETTENGGKKTKRLICILLIAVPVFFEIMVMTFPNLVGYDARLVYNGMFTTLSKKYGPLFWTMAIYNYLLLLISLLRLLFSQRDKPSTMRKQMLLVTAAASVTILANIIRLTGNSPYNIDLSPMAFSIAAMIITFGVVRFNLFKIIPIARSLVIMRMKAGMAVFDGKGNLLDLNPALIKLMGIESIPEAGTKIETVFAGAPELIRIFESRREQTSELSIERKGICYYYETSLMAIRSSGGKEIAWLFQLYDITERKLAEDIIEQAAYHDVLTGLPNRQYFQLMLSQEITLAKMRDGKLAVAFVDLDNFKHINDNYGHECGDLMLKAVTKRLSGVLREADMIARLGGDEFAIIIPGVKSDEEIEAIGKRLLSVFEENFNLVEYMVPMHASIGFSIYPEDGDSNEILLRKADKAMYQVKKAGKNNYRSYNGNELTA